MKETNELERITFQKIGRSILAVLNLERGIFYTILVLLTKPGEAIETYLKRDRKKLVEPVRFSLVVLAVTTLVFLKFEGGDALSGIHDGILEAGLERGVKENPVEAKKVNLFIDFIKDYCNIFLVFIIPIMASFSRDMFNDSDYNGAEHLVINAYIFSFQSLIYIFISLTSRLFSFEYGLPFVFLFSTLYQIITYLQIFNEPKIRGIYRSVSTIFVSFFIYFVLFIISLFVVLVL